MMTNGAQFIAPHSHQPIDVQVVFRGVLSSPPFRGELERG